MNSVTFVPDWRSIVRWSAPRPDPALLVDEPDCRALVAGLEPGAAIPPHAGPLGVYQFVEGSGTMAVDEEAFDVSAGSVVVVPRGSRRAITATTRLAFIAVRIGPELSAGG